MISLRKKENTSFMFSMEKDLVIMESVREIVSSSLLYFLYLAHYF